MSALTSSEKQQQGYKSDDLTKIKINTYLSYNDKKIISKRFESLYGSNESIELYYLMSFLEKLHNIEPFKFLGESLNKVFGSKYERLLANTNDSLDADAQRCLKIANNLIMKFNNIRLNEASLEATSKLFLFNSNR